MPSPATVPASRVVSAVAGRFGVPEDQLRARGRTRMVATARHTAMYLCRTMSGLSLPAIGAEFGRDHTTALNGIRQVQLWRAQDETWRVLLQDLAAELRSWERPAALSLVVLECPVCRLAGDETLDVAAAVQLAGTHDDLSHRGHPVTVVRAAGPAGGAR